MSVYIDMEMPKSCLECRLYNDPWCMAKNRNQWRTAYNRPPKGERQNDCPLIPVQPHGDLIDRDKLIESVSAEICDCNPDHFDLDDKDGYGKWMLHNGINTGIVAARVRIKGAPTIIPAKEGE